MRVFLFDAFKDLLLRKTDVPKTYRKSKFLGKKVWRTALALKSKKVQGIFGKNLYFDIIIFSCLSSTKLCLRLLLNCFVREIKGFYQISLGNEADFRDIMNVSPNMLAENQNVKTGFVGERVLIATTLISSCH